MYFCVVNYLDEEKRKRAGGEDLRDEVFMVSAGGRVGLRAWATGCFDWLVRLGVADGKHAWECGTHHMDVNCHMALSDEGHPS